jgi:hypothetical protein
MDFEETVTKKKSLGVLRKATKTKDRSPDSTGILKLERHTFDAIAKQFQETDADSIDCCLAAWRNIDGKGESYVTVELSPKYVSRRHEPAHSELADFI